jgi:3-oxo-5-alpha-steroid 4-dehydrogenase 3
VSSTIKWIHIEPKITNLTLLQVTLTLAFFWAWSHQFKAHKIFAELKLKSSAKHSVPYGDWFKYVSCPHYLAEILIYLIFAGILGFSHLTGWLVFGWVLTNQMVAGLMSHSWYKKNFKTYPDNRRAVIPYLI